MEVEGQTFAGYTAVVGSMKEVNTAYAKVCRQHPDARHVLGACRSPGENWHILQDFNDDDEHGQGNEFLHLLVSCKMFNHAVFVACIYDGTHIGEKRVKEIQSAAISAIATAPFNKEIGSYQFPWPQVKPKPPKVSTAEEATQEFSVHSNH